MHAFRHIPMVYTELKLTRAFFMNVLHSIICVFNYPKHVDISILPVVKPSHFLNKFLQYEPINIFFGYAQQREYRNYLFNFLK